MRPRDEDVVFVVDENCGPHVVDGLRDAGCNAILLTERVPPGTLDVDWIPRVREWGHAIVTRDMKMRGNPEERNALALCGVHVFIIRGGGLTFDELRARAKLHGKAMLRYVVKYATPFLAHVTSKEVQPRTPELRRSGVKREA